MPIRVGTAAAVLLVGACGTVLAACGTAGTPASPPGGPWRVGYTGYGHVDASTSDGTTRITLQPATPTEPAQTHAALVLSHGSWGDFAATIRLRTNRQLRTPHPNPWEVGWVLWHYRAGHHFYYIALKPNGWELGKADPHYPGDQRFLQTASRPQFPPGRWYTIRVTQRGNRIAVAVDGRCLVDFTDQQDPYRYGEIGLYAEDASVTFQAVSIGPAA